MFRDSLVTTIDRILKRRPVCGIVLSRDTEVNDVVFGRSLSASVDLVPAMKRKIRLQPILSGMPAMGIHGALHHNVHAATVAVSAMSGHGTWKTRGLIPMGNMMFVHKL
jgi:hypothetical protein